MPPGRTFEQPVPRGHTALAYVFGGEALLGEPARRVPAPRLVVLGDGDVVRVRTAAAPARFLLLSGRPIGEPVARYGPFVMNTEQELREALAELRAGTFVKP
jgi:redox-sensitive bicupin YhaK (pirin superfamily)